MSVNPDRIAADIAAIGRFTPTPGAGSDRPTFSPAWRQARDARHALALQMESLKSGRGALEHAIERNARLSQELATRCETLEQELVAALAARYPDATGIDDGTVQLTYAEMIADIEQTFNATGLEKDVTGFLDIALERGWISV